VMEGGEGVHNKKKRQSSGRQSPSIGREKEKNLRAKNVI